MHGPDRGESRCRGACTELSEEAMEGARRELTRLGTRMSDAVCRGETGAWGPVTRLRSGEGGRKGRFGAVSAAFKTTFKL